MNRPRSFFLCLLLTALVGLPVIFAATAKPGRRNATKSPDHYGQTKQRIDNLLKRRLTPDPLPATLPNPFQVPGAVAGTEIRGNGEPDGGKTLATTESFDDLGTGFHRAAHQTPHRLLDRPVEALALKRAGETVIRQRLAVDQHAVAIENNKHARTIRTACRRQR